MRYKSVFFAALAFLAVNVFYISAAQPVLQEKAPRRTFGYSLYDTGNDVAGAKKNKENSDDDTIRVSTDLVVSDVLVLDQKGNPVIGLGKDDFIVREDGVSQEVESFSFGNTAKVPRSIVLIIDYSSSIQNPDLKNSIIAAKVLVNKLDPQDRMAIVTDDVKLLVDYTRDKDVLNKALDELLAKTLSGDFGDSRQCTALLVTLKEMFDEEDLRPIVILQSDGDETPGLKDPQFPPPSEFITLMNDYSLDDLSKIADNARATIYSIFPGTHLLNLSPQARKAAIDNYVYNRFRQVGLRSKLLEDSFRQMANLNWEAQVVLEKLTVSSGGYIDFLEKTEDAGTVYTKLFETISNRYVVGYYPSNETRDDRRRHIDVEVRGHPEYTIQGRKTYFRR